MFFFLTPRIFLGVFFYICIMESLYYFKRKEFFIDLKLWDKFKKIKHEYGKSDYYVKRILWDLTDFTQEEISELRIYIHIVANNVEKFKEKDKIPLYIRNLLRRTHFDHDFYEINLISLGYKRPFGDSSVHSNIIHELIYEYNFVSNKEESKLYHLMDTTILYKELEEHLLENIDFKEIFNEYYIHLLYLIDNWEFKYTEFDINVISGDNSGNSNGLNQVQIENKYTCMNTHFFPKLHLLRKEIIDKLV
jgi:hypothetical protein